MANLAAHHATQHLIRTGFEEAPTLEKMEL